MTVGWTKIKWQRFVWKKTAKWTWTQNRRRVNNKVGGEDRRGRMRQKSWRAIVLGSCLQGGAVSSLKEKEWGKKSREAQRGRKGGEKHPCKAKTWLFSQRHSVCLSPLVCNFSHVQHTHSPSVQSMEAAALAPPPTPTASSREHKTKQVLSPSSRTLTPSSAPHSQDRKLSFASLYCPTEGPCKQRIGLPQYLIHGCLSLLHHSLPEV